MSWSFQAVGREMLFQEGDHSPPRVHSSKTVSLGRASQAQRGETRPHPLRLAVAKYARHKATNPEAASGSPKRFAPTRPPSDPPSTITAGRRPVTVGRWSVATRPPSITFVTLPISHRIYHPETASNPDALQSFLCPRSLSSELGRSGRGRPIICQKPEPMSRWSMRTGRATHVRVRAMSRESCAVGMAQTKSTLGGPDNRASSGAGSMSGPTSPCACGIHVVSYGLLQTATPTPQASSTQLTPQHPTYSR